jgi:hypothetical protein
MDEIRASRELGAWLMPLWANGGFAPSVIWLKHPGFLPGGENQLHFAKSVPTRLDQPMPQANNSHQSGLGTPPQEPTCL